MNDEPRDQDRPPDVTLDQLGEDDGVRDIVVPDHFISPTNSPLHIEATAVPADDGQGWIMLRCETIHGSYVCFMLPDVAHNLAEQLDEASVRAKLLVT
jgi:hypothetical protein